MQIQVTWKNGALYPVRPLKLKHTIVTVDIPEAEIEPVDLDDANRQYQTSLDKLLAQSPDDAWLRQMKEIEERVSLQPENELPELTARQLQNIEAFSLREDS